MALPVVTAINNTVNPAVLTRLGLTIPANSSLLLTDFAYIDEIKSDETLFALVLAGGVVFDLGTGVLSTGESLKLYNIISQEMRKPVSVLSDTNIVLLSGIQTIDSILLVAEDRVLLTGQTSQIENGVWIAKAGVWVRPFDFNTNQSSSGASFYIEQGAIYGTQTWQCVSLEGSDVIGTNNLIFLSFNSASAPTAQTLDQAYVAGNNITTSIADGDVVIGGTEKLLINATNGLSVTAPATFVSQTFSASSVADMNLSSQGAMNLTGTNGVNLLSNSSITGNLDVSGNIKVSGNLDVLGSITSINSEVLNIADPNLFLNKNYTSTSPTTGGLVVNYLPLNLSDTVAAGGFVAGVAATSNPTITTVGTATFAVGDLIQISGTNSNQNDGIFEVLSHVGTLLTIRGVGLTTSVENFTQTQFTTDTVVLGTITNINVSVIRAGVDGIWETGMGSSTGIVFTDLASSGGITLTDAYLANNTLNTTLAGGSVNLGGTQSVNVSAALGLSVSTSLDVTGTGFNVALSGGNGFTMSGTGASSLSADSSNLTLSTVTSGLVILDGSSGVNLNASAGAVNIGSNVTDVAVNIGTVANLGRTVNIGNNTGTSGVVISSGSEGVLVDGIRYYGKSAGAPIAATGGFIDGDKYFDTNLSMEMRYDTIRGAWLSVESSTFSVGRNKRTAPGQYYRGINGRVLSSTIGFPAMHNGVIVGFGYTREDFDAATFEITASGVAVASLASSAISGNSQSLNGGFLANSILAVRNSSGSNKTDEVQAWVRVKWTI